MHVYAYVYVCACVCSNSYLKSLSQLKTKFTWDHHGVGEKIYSNDSGQLLFFILILSAPGSGAFSGAFTTNLAQQCRAFSGAFTTNLARQCRAFSRALKIEKLKAPLFRGPKGAGATNDGCINSLWSLSHILHICKKCKFKHACSSTQ